VRCESTRSFSAFDFLRGYFEPEFLLERAGEGASNRGCRELQVRAAEE
jgi:hypothetical protein